MLYQTSADMIAIEEEVLIINHYISLEQLRYDDSFKVQFTTDIEDGKQPIPPLLLIPLVENAFKHGTGFIKDPQINIRLKVKNGLLEFDVRNKFSSDDLEVKDKASGIGLPNTIRRLNLLYGNKQELSITKDTDWFNVSLKIQLK